jgi:hypothetical protein
VKRAVDLGSRLETRISAIPRPTSLRRERSYAFVSVLSPGTIRRSTELRANPPPKWSFAQILRLRPTPFRNSTAAALRVTAVR